MTLSDPLAGDSPLAIRDRYFVPSVMAPFAEDMARRLARLNVGPLLELAADTGALTQAVAAAISAGVAIVATDPLAANVEYAALKSGVARITWLPADTDALPFGNGLFGIVTCHLGAASMPDRVAAYREALRVLKPNGRLILSTMAHLRQNPVAACVQAALESCHAGQVPTYLTRELYGYADMEMIDDDLTTAGFTDATYTAVDLPFAAQSAREVAIGYCLGTGLRTELQALGETAATDTIAAVTAMLRQTFGDGPIASSMRALVVSAAA